MLPTLVWYVIVPISIELPTVGLALLFTSGQWYRINRTLCEMLGYSEQELLKKRFQELVHPEDRFASMKPAALVSPLSSKQNQLLIVIKAA
jgi:PAS domain S-box-containing protein